MKTYTENNSLIVFFDPALTNDAAKSQVSAWQTVIKELPKKEEVILDFSAVTTIETLPIKQIIGLAIECGNNSTLLLHRGVTDPLTQVFETLKLFDFFQN